MLLSTIRCLDGAQPSILATGGAVAGALASVSAGPPATPCRAIRSAITQPLKVGTDPVRNTVCHLRQATASPCLYAPSSRPPRTYQFVFIPIHRPLHSKPLRQNHSTAFAYGGAVARSQITASGNSRIGSRSIKAYFTGFRWHSCTSVSVHGGLPKAQVDQ